MSLRSVVTSSLRLVDLTIGSSHEEEEANIPLTDLADDDAAALRPGSTFRWEVGDERDPCERPRRVSQVVFRDPPILTERDLQRAREWARETLRALGLERGRP